MDKRKGLAEKPFFVWVGIIASVIAIYAFVSGNQDIHDELDNYFAAGQPTVFLTPTLVPITGIYDVQFFFHWINSTGSEGTQFDESMLALAWDMTTADFRCGEYTECDYESFREFWLDWKVQATLYECSSNIIDAEQYYFPKDESSGFQPVGPEFRRYILIEEGGVRKIDEVVDIKGPCIFYEKKTTVTP